MSYNVQDEVLVKVSVKDFISRYVKYWPFFLISLIIALALAYTYLRYTTPLYNVRATMLIKTSNSNSGIGPEEFESMYMMNNRPSVTNELEILRSLSLAKRVASALNLQKKYYVKGNVKTTETYPHRESPVELKILKLADSTQPVSLNIYIHNDKEFSLNNVESKKYYFNQVFELNGGTYQIQRNDSVANIFNYNECVLQWIPLQSAGFDVLAGLNVAPIKDQSNVIQLSYLTPHRKMGEDIINQIMIEYKKLNIEDKKEKTSTTIAFINERLDLITRELGDVENNLQGYKQKYKVVNIGAQTDAFIKNQTDIDKQLSELEIRKNIISYLQEYILNKKNRNNLVPASLGIEEPSLEYEIKQYNELQLSKEATSQTTLQDNPLLKGLDVQIEKLRSDMLETLRNLQASLELTSGKLAQKNTSNSNEISAVPIREKELLEITRQQGIKQQLYLYLLEKREETAIAQSATVSSSSIIDPAISSSVPVKPNPLTIKVLAIFFGLLIPVGVIYIRGIMDDKIGSRLDIKKITKIPIIGEIGHTESENSLVVKMKSRDVVTEQFRMLRSNIKYLINDTEKPVILITSTISGEGKSFISINTGAVMALAGKKTVVLEFDIRKPKIASGLNLTRGIGITNYLINNNIDPSELPQQVPEIENMFIISCGPIPPNPAEMLLSNKLDDLFEYLRNNFDAIIIDSAPAGLVSDAFTLGRFANSTFYIVRMGRTFKKQLYFIEELYSSNKLNKMGLLINDIKATSHYYSYGNYTGYGYGFGNNDAGKYFTNDVKDGWFSRVKGMFKK